jgi:hypothetical protein
MSWTAQKRYRDEIYGVSLRQLGTPSTQSLKASLKPTHGGATRSAKLTSPKDSDKAGVKRLVELDQKIDELFAETSSQFIDHDDLNRSLAYEVFGLQASEDRIWKAKPWTLRFAPTSSYKLRQLHQTESECERCHW